MNCITDFLPDDTSEHNADGESIEEVVFGVRPAQTLTPSELDAAVYGGKPSVATVAGFALDEINRLERERDDAVAIERALADASVEAHTETLERVKALEAEIARLRDVMIEALAFARTGLIPMEFEPYAFDGETRRLHWNEHMRIQIAKLIDAALK